MKNLSYLLIFGAVLLLMGCNSPTIEMQVRDVTQYTADIDFSYSGINEDAVWLDAVLFDTYGHRSEYHIDITPGEAYSFWFSDERDSRVKSCCWITTTPRTHGLTIRPVCDK